MTTRGTDGWLEMNRQELASAIATVREHLSRAVAGQAPQPVTTRAPHPPGSADTTETSALSVLRSAFGLSAFERDLVALCAAPELDVDVGRLIARARGDERRVAATPELAMSVLPDAHWSAFAPTAPLRRWRILELSPAELFATSTLRLDERVLQFVVGVDCADDRLEAITSPVAPPSTLTASARDTVAGLVRVWETAAESAVQLCGDRWTDAESIATTAVGALGWRLRRLRSSDIPASATERAMLARLLEREAALASLIVAIDAYDVEPAAADRAIALLDILACPVLVTGRDALEGLHRPWHRVDVPGSSAAERRVVWSNALTSDLAVLNGDGSALIDVLSRQFSFDAPEIETTVRRTRVELATRQARSETSAAHVKRELWHQCRITARARLESLAERVDARPKWDELVLPPSHVDTLREIVAHVRQRHRVHDAWGFASTDARGLGVSALFVGPSGTGKTMAAEVLAAELDLDLWRVDLSAVVSKYIGETEKNLRRVFDAAGAGNAILLFDEADALFGKRSEVKDSHDRYANIEVSYLLQRMESYRGLAILTTNQKAALDTAFLRRIRFVLTFPFPEAGARERMWQRVFPTTVPLADVDPGKLSRLVVAGGSIRSIALNAAFLAADADEPVQMKHLLRAAKSECSKIERAPTPAEISDWVAEQ